MDYPIHFANQLKLHLRSLRQAKGLTQSRLGELVGLPQSRIAEFEADPGVARIDLLFRVATALGVQVVLRDKADIAVAEPPADAEPAAPGAKPGPATPASSDSW